MSLPSLVPDIWFTTILLKCDTENHLVEHFNRLHYVVISAKYFRPVFVTFHFPNNFVVFFFLVNEEFQCFSCLDNSIEITLSFWLDFFIIETFLNTTDFNVKSMRYLCKSV